MPLTYLGVQKLLISSIKANPLSANVEDGATYERLKEELQKNGLVELPVVLKSGDEPRFLAGHHRSRAWAELGHENIDCIVLQGSLTQEEEFNLINNLNLVKGYVTTKNLKRIVRGQKLDPLKLDLFKFPVSRFLPSLSAAGAREAMFSRRVKIRDLAFKIAPKIAEILLDHMDAGIVVFLAEDAPVAIIHVTLPKSQVRQNISLLKAQARKAFDAWLETPSSEDVENEE
jgi:ParB-like chromosome segregation protein Spo0J